MYNGPFGGFYDKSSYQSAGFQQENRVKGTDDYPSACYPTTILRYHIIAQEPNRIDSTFCFFRSSFALILRLVPPTQFILFQSGTSYLKLNV